MARLLVVEDEPDIRDLIALNLLTGGHRVLAAADAAGALQTVDSLGPPDAYVLDVQLPDVDGFELLAQLREAAEPDIPAIFVSAFGQPSNVERGEQMGAAAYLVKPVGARRLLGVVDRALTSRPSGGDAAEHAW
jgi:CheY-like chemotaxis protein